MALLVVEVGLRKAWLVGRVEAVGEGEEKEDDRGSAGGETVGDAAFCSRRRTRSESEEDAVAFLEVVAAVVEGALAGALVPAPACWDAAAVYCVSGEEAADDGEEKEDVEEAESSEDARDEEEEDRCWE